MLRLLGRCLLLEAACMLLPLLTAFYYGESPLPFVYAILVTAAAGSALSVLPAERAFFAREGFVIASAIWLSFCLFGALPFLFSGCFESFADCLFEIASGFSTTGATVLGDVESLPRGILFWRSFSSWLGGMGVLTFTLAFLPASGARTQNLLRAELTGPVVSKLVPKTARSSQILYGIYISLTVLEVLCLSLAGMPFFDALLHSFATVSTGGFSIKNSSIAAYGSPLIEHVILLFILLSSINFSVYFLLLTRRFQGVRKSDELRWFLAIVGISALLVTLNLQLAAPAGGTGLAEHARQALFQVASVMSTTGFVTADFNQWPEFSKMLLLGLMLVGGCAGSTSGGIKVSRILLLLRSIRRDVRQISHPRAVKIVTLDGKEIEERALSHVAVFVGAYLFLIAIACFFVSLDGLPLTTTVTAVIASIGNIGPGFDLVGPMANYSIFSGLSKLVLSLVMIIGRLEIFPLLLLLTPSTWRRA